MVRILGISDDLTGAVACAAELSRGGSAALVRPWDGEVDADVLVVDTRSRLVDPVTAAARVRAAIERDGRGRFVYKRVDSRLRGNVAAELAAVVEVTHRPLVLAPAAPAWNVSTVGGVQLIDGMPVGNASDTMERATSARLADTAPGAVHVGLDAVRSARLETALREALSNSDAVACDTETSDDLAAVGAACAALGDAIVPVGSYGLAAPWLAALRPRRAGVLVVAGSVDNATRRQLERLAAGGIAVLRSDAHQADICARLGGGEAVALAASHPDEPPPGVTVAGATHGLAARVRDIVAAARPLGVVLIGGELASETLQACGVEAVEVVAERWLATPIVRFRGGALDGLMGAVKSGARADASWAVEAVDALRMQDGQP
jgi:4-hydroxythreonine-4-phosphate dehydrogenase